MADIKSTLKSEAKAKDAEESEEQPGGVKTTDPTFADGAMEVNEGPWNPPEETPAETPAEPEPKAKK